MRLATLVCVAVVASCTPSVGTFSATSFGHPKYAYSVRYHDATKQALMPPDWQLDNFHEAAGSLVHKTGADYESTILLDVDGDGTRDKVDEQPIFDLRFTHKRTSAVAWIRTIPLEVNNRDKEPRVLLESLVASMSGGERDVIQLDGKLHATNSERRYATKYISTGKATLAGREAFHVTIDVSNVDRLNVDPKSVEMRMALVLAKTDFEFEHGHMSDPARQKFPVVLLAGYANSPADFSASEKDFLGLLSRLEIANKVGFALAEPSAPPAAASAAASSAPAATTPVVTPPAVAPPTPPDASAPP